MYNTSYSIKTGRYSKVMQGTRIATYKVICRPTRLEQEGKRGKGSPVMRQSLIIPHPKPTYLKSLPSRPPARLFTIDPPNALFAKVDAWLNLSHREKASVLVMVKASAMAVKYQYRETLQETIPRGGLSRYSPTRLSQITFCSLMMARMARPTHSAGATYRLSQKKRLSVAAMVREFGSEDSKTQCESPLDVLTSFHQRRPTRRRPAMFLR